MTSSLPTLLRTRRMALQLSQADLAARLGWVQSRLSRFETGAREPSLDALRELAGALGVPALDLATAALQEQPQ